MWMPQISPQARPANLNGRARKDEHRTDPDSRNGAGFGPPGADPQALPDQAEPEAHRTRTLDEVRRDFANGHRTRLDISL